MFGFELAFLFCFARCFTPRVRSPAAPLHLLLPQSQKKPHWYCLFANMIEHSVLLGPSFAVVSLRGARIPYNLRNSARLVHGRDKMQSLRKILLYVHHLDI